MEEPDAPVFVIDLGDTRDERPAGDDGGAGHVLDAPIALVAIQHEDRDIELQPVEPTEDLRFLDALARLIRFAHAKGLSVRLVAERYGSEYERRLLFERRLPAWSLDWSGRVDRR